jgi:protein SCO1/2
MMMPRYTALLTIVLIPLALAGCGGSNDTEWNGHDIRGAMPDLEYILTGETGDTVRAGDYDGDVRLLVFGFSHCPDMCPATLGRLAAAVASLPETQRERVRILFVSVDPKRDTPQRLAEYTDRFGPRVVGLTGTQEQLTELTGRYRVTYGYGEPDAEGFYTVSHSGAVFVFGPEDEARLLFNQSLSVADITADLKRLL